MHIQTNTRTYSFILSFKKRNMLAYLCVGLQGRWAPPLDGNLTILLKITNTFGPVVFLGICSAYILVYLYA